MSTRTNTCALICGATHNDVVELNDFTIRPKNWWRTLERIVCSARMYFLQFISSTRSFLICFNAYLEKGIMGGGDKWCVGAISSSTEVGCRGMLRGPRQ